MKLTIYGPDPAGHYSASGQHLPTSDPSLSPCPFCGSTDITVTNTHSPFYVAQCQTCDASKTGEPQKGGDGRIFTMEQCAKLHNAAFISAMAKWNDRRGAKK